MPELFVDRVVQKPKQFSILADGTNGTSNDPALNGKVIDLTVNPGVITVPGTSLNAEELNKRIVADYEDVTLTELRTLLDTLQIDKDANGNLVVKELGFRTSYQMVINGNAGNSWVGDNNGSKLSLDTAGNVNLNNVYTPGNQNFNIVSGRKYLGIVEVDTADALSGLLRFYYDNAVIQNFNNLVISQRVASFITASETGLANFAFVEAAVLGSIAVLKMMLIDVTDEVGTEDQIRARYANYFEGKTNTKNPKIQTIGKNLIKLAKDSINVNGLTIEAIGNGQIKINGNATVESRINIIENFIFGASGSDIVALGKEVLTIKDDYKISVRHISGTQIGGSASRLTALDKNSVTITQTILVNSADDMDLSDKEIGALYLQLQTTDTYNDFIIECQIEPGLIALADGQFAEYNSNEGNELQFTTKDLKPVEGESVSYNGITKSDKIIRINNKYYLQKQILVEGEQFQIGGGVSGNWSNTFGNNMDADFVADLGFDIEPEIDADGLGFNPYCRIIIDGTIYLPQNTFTPTDLYFSIGNVSLTKDIRIRNDNYPTTATWAAYIAAATEIIFDVLMPVDDFELTELISNGYTIVEENGTVIQLSEDNAIAYEVETEIPVNIPAQIKMNTFDIRRLWNSKMEMVLLEDFSESALIIPRKSVGTPVDLTDNFEFEVYALSLYHDATPAKEDLLIFFKITGTSLVVQYPFARYYSSGSGEVVPQISIATDNINKKFTAEDSTLFVNDVEDTGDDTYVLAVYGLKAVGGDLR